MSKRQEFACFHHRARFRDMALPLWYLTGILSDVPPDVSADALHAGRRQLAILFAVFTVIFLIGMIVFRLGRLPRSKFQIAALIVLMILVSFPFLLYFSIASEVRLGKVILALYTAYLVEICVMMGQILLSPHKRFSHENSTGNVN